MAAGIAAILIDRTIKQQQQLTWHEESSQVLYEIVHHIINGSTTNETLHAIEISLGKILNGDCEIILRENENRLTYISKSKLISN
jgi:K+-sensing histidine kinase KdpD